MAKPDHAARNRYSQKQTGPIHIGPAYNATQPIRSYGTFAAARTTTGASAVSVKAITR